MLNAGVRIAFLGLGILASVGCATLLLSHQGPLAAKTAWIAALLLLFAADPTRFGPSSVNAAGSNFYATGFALLSLLFLIVFVLLLVFVQLPHERIPHFDGRITRLLTENGRQVPEVQFVSDDGLQVTFIDRISPVMYPKRMLHEDEAVSVIVVSKEHPRIDEPWYVRWSTMTLMGAMAVAMAAFAFALHARVAD